MSDNLNIPVESWRTPRRKSSPVDPQMVRMGVIAAGVVGVVLLGVGGYALMGHRAHGIPVVEADSRPIRVRPDNPGGNMVEGAEEQVMGGHGSGQADAMAPPVEAPAPQALRAEIQAARQPAPTAVPTPAPAAPVATPAGQAEDPALPPAQRISLSVPPVTAPPAVSAVPENASAGRAAARPNVANGPPLVSPGGMQVQLGALDSEQAALGEWQRLTHRMPDLLGQRHPAVVRSEHAGKPVWRLRTGGFTDIASATAFCSQVRSKGVGCAIASF
jgi:hypothetical protein